MNRFEAIKAKHAKIREMSDHCTVAEMAKEIQTTESNVRQILNNLNIDAPLDVKKQTVSELRKFLHGSLRIAGDTRCNMSRRLSAARAANKFQRQLTKIKEPEIMNSNICPICGNKLVIKNKVKRSKGDYLVTYKCKAYNCPYIIDRVERKKGD